MKFHRLLQRTGIVFTASMLLVVFIYLFFPVAKLNSALNRFLAEQGLRLDPAASKALLPGLVWEQPVLSSEQGELLRMERLSVGLDLTALLTGRIKLKSAGSIGSGSVRIILGMNGSEALQMDSEGVELGNIPFFSSVLKARAAGRVWCQGGLQQTPKGLQGDIRLEVKQLAIRGAKLGAFALPDVSGLTTRGIVRFTGSNARLESFTLEGDGIYMRLSGNLPGGMNALNLPLELTLEIMPKPEFMESQKLIFMLLTKYMISPGNYRIPIRGNLLKPEIL